MYNLNIKQKDSKTLYLKTIIGELDLLKKNSYYSIKYQKKKGFLLLATKLVKNT